MPYIGNQPSESFTSFATQEFSTSATTSYTLDHAVTNENEIALFINNVRQQPGSGKAYTATGTALTLSAATASTDTMYCVFLGRALQTVTPATNSITNAMITDSTITSAKLTGVTQGITMADQWRLTTAFTGDAEPISSNLERNDTQFSYIGSGMSESSGVFTFPSTGIYLIRFYHMYQFKDGNAQSRDAKIMHTTNNSSYSAIGLLNRNGFDEGYDIRSIEAMLDVTDTSNIKVRFDVTGASTNDRTTGDSTLNETCMTFIRLGDT